MEMIKIVTPQKRRVDDKFIPLPNMDAANVYITLKNNGYNVETLRENLKTLKINITDEINNSYYHSIDNEIFCLPEDYKNNITHELLHASTCITDGNGIHSGLMSGDWLSNTTLGLCINEGMTATMDNKLFGNYTDTKEEYESSVYPFAKGIIEYLSILVPFSKIEECYFNSDLVSLIEELSKIYPNAGNIIKFLCDTDYVFRMIDVPYNEPTEEDVPQILESYKSIQVFLAEGIYYKLNKKYEEGVINKAEYKDFLDIVKDLLKARIVYNDLFTTPVAMKEYKGIKKRYIVRKHQEKNA